MMYEDIFKPIFDRLIAFLFVTLFWWLFIIVAIIVRVKLGSPVLFVQERPGKIDPLTGKEKIFKLYKFRTMTDGRDSEGNLLPDKDRLTSFGKLLRSTSLDEIPEIFFNVLLFHNMSLVGPRPLLVEYLPIYSKEQRRRHNVMPGLTGYAQVCGRNELSWDERFKKDIWYVDNISFLLDCRVIFSTFALVLMRKGINSQTSVTMDRFVGNTDSKLKRERKK